MSTGPRSAPRGRPSRVALAPSARPRALVSRASKTACIGPPTVTPQEDMMATLTCPNCAAAVKQDDLICFTCGANLPRIRPRDEDAPAPTTVMQEYLRPRERNSNISPAVLRLSFPTGNVEVPAGTTLLLGRDPAESLA